MKLKKLSKRINGKEIDTKMRAYSEPSVVVGKHADWLIHIDDGYISYEFKPRLGGDYSIEQVCKLIQTTFDMVEDNEDLKEKILPT